MSADRRQRHEQDQKRPGVLESGQAAALWAAGAVAGSLLLPGGSMTLPEEPEKMGWTVLRVCAVLPLGEELIFRGGVQRLLRPLGPGVALAGQAVLFAAAHGSAEHTGRLWPGMGLHCLNNCIVLAGCLAERGLG